MQLIPTTRSNNTPSFIANSHNFDDDIQRYKLLDVEIKRLEPFESELDSNSIQQMKMEKLVLEQFLATC